MHLVFSLCPASAPHPAIAWEEGGALSESWHPARKAELRLNPLQSQLLYAAVLGELKGESAECIADQLGVSANLLAETLQGLLEDALLQWGASPFLARYVPTPAGLGVLDALAHRKPEFLVMTQRLLQEAACPRG